jgi:hypothetical protein
MVAGIAGGLGLLVSSERPGVEVLSANSDLHVHNQSPRSLISFSTAEGIWSDVSPAIACEWGGSSEPALPVDCSCSWVSLGPQLSQANDSVIAWPYTAGLLRTKHVAGKLLDVLEMPDELSAHARGWSFLS